MPTLEPPDRTAPNLQHQRPAAPQYPHVILSRWVNERCPPWNELLTTRDVARLTRRNRWVLRSLVWLRRFPRPCRYHGYDVGWFRTDILRWLTRDCRIASPGRAAPRNRDNPQLSLNLGRPCRAVRRRGAQRCRR
jgi:predicted DNA-binding transcriptional regulator AlpA